MTSVEGNEPSGGNPTGNGNAESEDKRIPIVGIRLAGVAQVADAGYIGREDTHANHPSRDASAGIGELLRAGVASVEQTAHQYDTACED